MPERDIDRERLADAMPVTSGHDGWDARTHIERLNGDGSAAAVPGIAASAGRPFHLTEDVLDMMTDEQNERLLVALESIAGSLKEPAALKSIADSLEESIALVKTPRPIPPSVFQSPKPAEPPATPVAQAPAPPASTPPAAPISPAATPSPAPAATPAVAPASSAPTLHG